MYVLLQAEASETKTFLLNCSVNVSDDLFNSSLSHLLGLRIWRDDDGQTAWKPRLQTTKEQSDTFYCKQGGSLVQRRTAFVPRPGKYERKSYFPDENKDIVGRLQTPTVASEENLFLKRAAEISFMPSLRRGDSPSCFSAAFAEGLLTRRLCHEGENKGFLSILWVLLEKAEMWVRRPLHRLFSSTARLL